MRQQMLEDHRALAVAEREEKLLMLKAQTSCGDQDKATTLGPTTNLLVGTWTKCLRSVWQAVESCLLGYSEELNNNNTHWFSLLFVQDIPSQNYMAYTQLHILVHTQVQTHVQGGVATSKMRTN